MILSPSLPLILQSISTMASETASAYGINLRNIFTPVSLGINIRVWSMTGTFVNIFSSISSSVGLEGTTLADGTKAKDGYVALNALDTNLDGLIDANDAAFSQLSVWVDRNGDAQTNSGELASLTELGITSISLNAQSSTAVNNGNLIGLMGSYTTADGRTHTMGDVWFSVDTDGSRVFDLSAVIDKTGSVPHVDLNASPAATLNVSLQDVLTLGNQDLGSGLTTVRIDGGTDDTVQLAQADGNWTQSGTVTDGAESYAIYVNQEAQLLVNQKIHTQII
jgi:hypothetical protein